MNGMGMSILLFLLALAVGIAVSGGTFAFLMVIGVLPRVLKKASLGKRVMETENAVVIGVCVGAVLSIIDFQGHIWGGKVILFVYALGAGMFVGCVSAALAEILRTFPILFRRLCLKRGLSFVMFAMAMGKAVGSFFYFLMGYDIL